MAWQVWHQNWSQQSKNVLIEGGHVADKEMDWTKNIKAVGLGRRYNFRDYNRNLIIEYVKVIEIECETVPYCYNRFASG